MWDFLLAAAQLFVEEAEWSPHSSFDAAAKPTPFHMQYSKYWFSKPEAGMT